MRIHFTEENIQMLNKHFDVQHNYSLSKYKLNSQFYTHARMAKMKNNDNTKCW